jgi:hypothetical protein
MTSARMIRSSLVIAGLATGFSAAAFADGPQAVATAAQHAGFAAASTDIAGVHLHLHHVLNCLVGPQGEGFDGAAGNPCSGTGAAIPQTMDSAIKMKLENVAAQARMGIADNNLETAQKTAMEIQSELE